MTAQNIPNFHYHKNDLPLEVFVEMQKQIEIAIDTESMGLKPIRDRLCLVQLGLINGEIHIVHFVDKNLEAKNLKSLLINNEILKIFHFARADLATLQYWLKIEINNVFCTKLASRLVRTYSNNHGLSDLCSELLNLKISKKQQTSDWGSSILDSEQLTYAAGDVLYLHKIKELLLEKLIREKREILATRCFEFLPTLANLDLQGWSSSMLDYAYDDKP